MRVSRPAREKNRRRRVLVVTICSPRPMRAVLYMGALVATRHNPAIRDFYQRLLASGKPKKLALVACMRKLLVILNSMLKNGSPWCDMTQPEIAHSY